MAITVINRTFTDDQNRTLNFPFFSGYDRVKASYTIDVEFSFVIDPLNSIEKVGDSFTLNNGQSWEDYGFYAGATITGHYENGSSHNIPSSTTIVFVDGATMFLSNTLAGTDGTYTIGTFTIDSLPDAIGFDFNLVENTSTGSEYSVIDGEVNRFNADVSALTVSGTVVPSQLGNKSGGSQITTLITRLADVSGNKQYRIDVSFNPWTIKNPDLYFSTGCIKPWIRIEAFPEYQNPSVKISTISVPTDANVGLTNEVGNGGAPEYTLGYINLEDRDGNPLPSIDYNQPTCFEIRINGVFNSSSKFNLTLWHDTTDDAEFKNLPTNFDQNNIVIKNNSALAFSASPFAPIYSPTRTDGVELAIEDLTSTSHGTYAIFTGKIVPNGAFTNLINDKQPTDRLYKLWIRCENPTLTSNNVRPVWVNIQESVFSKAVIPLGKYGISMAVANHENTILRSANDVITEDDIRLISNFKVPKFNNFERISVSTVVVNSVTNESFNLEQYNLDLSTLPELPDGTKPINFVLNRGFKLSPTNQNNVINIIRNPLLDDSDEYGVKIEYSALIRWEYWLEQIGTALAFYGDSTKNWFNYQSGNWGVGFLIQIDTPDGSYQDFELLDIHGYDQWTAGTGSTTVQYFREDGVTAITKPIVGELTHVKVTFTNTLFAVGGGWGQLTSEGFELSPRWDLSTVWDWDNVSQNPWKPLAVETGLKLTESGTSKTLEGLLDVTKLPNPNKVSITGRISQKGDIPIEVRHKVTTETARLPKPEDLDNRGKTGNCCDCIYEVFADENSTETYRNHVSSRWLIGEDVTFELYKDSVLTSFQPVSQSFPNDTGAKYCTIPWRDVLISDGRGCYVLKGISESAGITTEKTLGVFKLEQFDWARLVDKIMIRSVFNDANIREQINFTNAEVQDCIVIDGDIEEYQPNTQINNLVKANFEQVKVKRENRTLWTVNINFADFCHMKRLTDLHLVGENQMFVSDFRKDAFDKTLLDKAVILNESANLTPIYRSERQKATFVVAEKIVDHLTRYGSVGASGEVNAGDLPLPNVVNEQIPIDVTINGITVANDAVSDVALTLVDQNGGDVPFTQTGNELEVNVAGGGDTLFDLEINVDGVLKSTIPLDSQDNNIINVNLYS